MKNCTDAELISLLYDHHIKAFDILYYRYHGAIYQNIFKLVKDAYVAENILQEVFVILWEKRTTLDTERSLSGWLFTVSYNKSISHLKRSLKESLFNSQLENDMVDDTGTASDLKEARLQSLEEAMLHLSPQKMKVLNMCKLQGMSYEETARELKISKHTVKEYLSLAVNSLKEHMLGAPNDQTLLIFIIIALQYH